MGEPRPAGPMVDALGATLNLDEHDQLTDVLVIGRAADFESGETSVVVGTSKGLDWVTQHGLLAVARRVLDSGDIVES